MGPLFKFWSNILLIHSSSKIKCDWIEILGGNIYFLLFYIGEINYLCSGLTCALELYSYFTFGTEPNHSLIPTHYCVSNGNLLLILMYFKATLGRVCSVAAIPHWTWILHRFPYWENQRGKGGKTHGMRKPRGWDRDSLTWKAKPKIEFPISHQQVDVQPFPGGQDFIPWDIWEDKCHHSNHHPPSLLTPFSTAEPDTS